MNSQGQRLPVSCCTGTHEILRDAIRVLCTNTVPFKTQLSIDAIIGVTVDNTEIIFVNIHEIIEQAGRSMTDRHAENNRQKTPAVESGEVAQNERAYVVRKNELDHRATDEPRSGSRSRQCQTPAAGATVHVKSASNVNQFQTCSGQNSTFVGKAEPPSDVIEIEDDDNKDFKVELSADASGDVDAAFLDTMSAESGGCDVFEATRVTDGENHYAFADDFFEPGGATYAEDNWSSEMTDAGYSGDSVSGKRDYLPSKGANSGRQGAGGTYRCRVCFRTFIYHASYVRHRRRHHAWAPLAAAAAAAAAINGSDSRFASGGRGAVKMAASDVVGEPDRDEFSVLTTAPRVAAGEVGTVYTCSVCGQKIRHLSTFIRHKKQHEGVVFNCDICGFVTSRRDSLLVHRRRCVTKCRTLLGVE